MAEFTIKLALSIHIHKRGRKWLGSEPERSFPQLSRESSSGLAMVKTLNVVDFRIAVSNSVTGKFLCDSW
jgi:hypothetical protein